MPETAILTCAEECNSLTFLQMGTTCMINDTAAYNLAQIPRKGTEPPSKPNICSTPTLALH